MEQGPGLKHIRAHVHLVDAALLGRGVLLFDDADKGAGGVAHDPAEAGGIGGDRRSQQAVGLEFVKPAEQAGDAFGPQHRRIAADDYDGATGVGRSLREPLFDQSGGGGHGIARAPLFLLEGERHAWQPGQGLLNERGTVADDDDPVGDTCGGEGVEHPANERLPGSFEEHLRQIASHPRASAGSHDDGDGGGGSDAGRWGGCHELLPIGF